jgi:chromosome segregation ATPase
VEDGARATSINVAVEKNMLERDTEQLQAAKSAHAAEYAARAAQAAAAAVQREASAAELAEEKRRAESLQNDRAALDAQIAAEADAARELQLRIADRAAERDRLQMEKQALQREKQTLARDVATCQAALRGLVEDVERAKSRLSAETTQCAELEDEASRFARGASIGFSSGSGPNSREGMWAQAATAGERVVAAKATLEQEQQRRADLAAEVARVTAEIEARKEKTAGMRKQLTYLKGLLPAHLRM